MTGHPARVTTRRDPFTDFGFRGLAPFRLGSGVLDDWLYAPQSAAPAPSFTPRVDVSETEEAYLVTAELPGVSSENVEIEVHDGILSIRGTKSETRDAEKERTHFVERSFGSFTRAFKLPKNADVAKVDAAYRDGILTVTIAKSEEAKPRTIDIEVK